MIRPSVFFILGLFISILTHAAASEVECWDGDCLKNGWTVTEARSSLFLDHQCYRDGCMRSGWIVGGTGSGNYYTQCKEDLCFKRGWWEVNRRTQMLEATITCHTENGVIDCLRFGWTRIDKLTGVTSVTMCTDQNCRERGWQRYSTLGLQSEAVCKKNACFTNGWTQYDR